MRKLDNWIDAYLEYTQKQESPEKLHFWVAVSLISAAIKRQVWMDRGYYKLYPNTFVLIVAESARVRKSVAIDIGMTLVRAAVPDLYYITGTLTPEGLVKHMNRVKVNTNEVGKARVQYDSHVLIHADELAELFGYDRQRASKLTILLTKIYGSQREHMHTLASEGQILLRNLYPTLLAATDPRNLKVLPEEAVAGLIGRLIFVTARDRRHVVAWPQPGEHEQELYETLVEDLFEISQLRGEIVPTADARAFFKDWYVGRADTKIEDPRIDAFNERCHDTTLKLATIFALAAGDTLIVTLDQMKRGIEYVERQIPEFSHVMNWAASSTYAQNRAKFIDMLRRQGGVGMRRQALKMMVLPLEEILVLENSLEHEGTITTRVTGNNVFYKLSKDELLKE